mgnify:CR=1 FL=1
MIFKFHGGFLDGQSLEHDGYELFHHDARRINGSTTRETYRRLDGEYWIEGNDHADCLVLDNGKGVYCRICRLFWEAHSKPARGCTYNIGVWSEKLRRNAMMSSAARNNAGPMQKPSEPACHRATIA